MTDRTTLVRVEQSPDALGDPEVFSFDLWPVVEDTQTLHLDENGLPRPGTVMLPRMVLVGRIGKSSTYNSENEPTSLEIHAMTPLAARGKFGHMWHDNCVYVASGATFEVLSARLIINDNGSMLAELTIRWK